MSVKVYVEGGGDTNHALRAQCRQAFAEFFGKAGLRGRLPRVVASGSRKNAYDRFRSALGSGKPSETPLLVVDSEAPVANDGGPWEHLANREGDRWERPAAATDEQAHLMVQCMEAWFLADQACLKTYYGAGFRSSALRAWISVENIPRADVITTLRAATCDCPTKGEYSKGQHSFAILGQIDPAKVRAASPHAERLLNTLDRLCGSE